MSFPLGVGIITHNRKDIVAATIDKVRQLTLERDAVVAVADDGSRDGTLEMLREKRAPVITGTNMGIAWNKNRVLFLLSRMLRCETVVLLEDDTQPNREGWEQPWMDAARKHGHVNFAGGWLREHFESGSGTPDDPFRSKLLSAQCAAFSRTALAYGGYFDPAFRGCGHEHVEHTRRLVRVGYGGTEERVYGQERILYYLIKGDLTVIESKSHCAAEQGASNRALSGRLMGLPGYRAPWGDDREMRQFRSETESALAGGQDRFRIRQPTERPERLDRLLGRR